MEGAASRAARSDQDTSAGGPPSVSWQVAGGCRYAAICALSAGAHEYPKKHMMRLSEEMMAHAAGIDPHRTALHTKQDQQD